MNFSEGPGIVAADRLRRKTMIDTCGFAGQLRMIAGTHQAEAG